MNQESNSALEFARRAEEIHWWLLASKHTPVLVWGSPGVGKTAIAEAYAEASGAHWLSIVLHHTEPTDLRGVKALQEEVESQTGNRRHVVNEIPMAWIREIRDIALTGREVFLILDELTVAAPSVQAAALQLINERRAGPVQLPNNVRIISLANPPEQAAGGYLLSLPVTGRFEHAQFELDLVEWSEGFRSYWGNADERAAYHRVDPDAWAEKRNVIADYLQANPTELLQLPNDPSYQHGWPSPRSWANLSALLAAMPTRFHERAIVGAVGEAAGMRFFNWVRKHVRVGVADMLNDASVLANVQTHEAASLINDAVSYVGETKAQHHWEALWRALVWMKENGGDRLEDVMISGLVGTVNLLQTHAGVFSLPQREIEIMRPVLNNLRAED